MKTIEQINEKITENNNVCTKIEVEITEQFPFGINSLDQAQISYAANKRTEINNLVIENTVLEQLKWFLE